MGSTMQEFIAFSLSSASALALTMILVGVVGASKLSLDKPDRYTMNSCIVSFKVAPFSSILSIPSMTNLAFLFLVARGISGDSELIKSCTHLSKEFNDLVKLDLAVVHLVTFPWNNSPPSTYQS